MKLKPFSFVSFLSFALCVTQCHSSNDKCASEPCKHEGSCINTVGDRGYECRCLPGTVGENCDINTDECASNPCRNGGICIDGINNYICQCTGNFTGKNCADVQNHCTSHPQPCKNGQCINLDNGYLCENNDENFLVNGSGCHLKDCAADSSICIHGECLQNISTNKSYCKCYGGFHGDCCRIPKCASNPCEHGGTCHNYEHNFTCSCRPGYTGTLCENNVNECASHPCVHGQCLDLTNEYVCKCDGPYTGKNCDIDLCHPSPCRNGATCVPSNNSARTYKCICSPEYYGEHCEHQSNRCDTKPCKYGGTCMGNFTSYKCNCPKGFEGVQCEKSVYCEPNPCLNKGMCITLKTGGYKCLCSHGFAGRNCQQDRNECSESNPCLNNAECINDQGTFACKCQAGFSGKHCQKNDNDCFENSCLNNGTCFDQINKYTCKCPKGYTGNACQFTIDTCKVKPCMNGGTCSYRKDGFTCSCLEEFNGPRCECSDNDDSCPHNHCDIIGTKKHFLVGDSYKCVCFESWTGQNCDTYITCAMEPCLNGGQCHDSLYGAVCICPLGYTGDVCETQISICYPNPCQNQGKCTEKNSGYICSCPDWATGKHCELPVYLGCNESPCWNGGTCVQEDGSYICHCPKYWTGYKCQNSISAISRICLDNKCVEKGQNGACDQECNFEECLFDNMECSYGILPWKNCILTTADGKPCSQVFQNGICNQECVNEKCLFDGFDCAQPVGSCQFKGYCQAHYGNNQCDSGCNNVQCGWDGSDCSRDTQDFVDGSIFILLYMSPEDFEQAKNEFLYTLSHLVQSAVHIKRNSLGQEMIYHHSNATNSSLVSMINRWTDGSTIGIHLEVDVSGCGQKKMCFNNVESIAQFLAEYLRTQTLDSRFDVLHIEALQAAPPATESMRGQKLLLVVMLVVFVSSLAVVVTSMVLLRQKRVRGTTWFPENFKKGVPCAEPESPEEIQKDHRMAQIFVCEDHPTPPPSNEAKVDDDDDDDESPKPKRLKINRMISVDVDQQWKMEHLYVTSAALTPLQGVDIIPFDVNLKGPDGYTPLMLAAMRGSGLGDEEENNSGSLSSDCVEADSTRIDVMMHLISQGAAINAKTDKTHETALHLAARYTRADAAKVLLEAGADPNACDCTGRTPLHCAVAADALGVFQLLLRNRSTNLNARMHCGTTALMLACRLSIENTVEDMIEYDADLEAMDNNGKTALHWAAAVNNVNAVMILLSRNANRDAQTAKEETPLFLASREGAYESARALLDYYANRDLSDHMDRLPRDIALERRHLDIVHLLDSYKITSPVQSGTVSQCQPGLGYKNSSKQGKVKSKINAQAPESKNTRGVSLGHYSKAKKIRDEGEIRGRPPQSQNVKQISSSSLAKHSGLKFVSSSDTNTVSQTTNAHDSLVFTPVSYQVLQPGDLTRVDLLSNWDKSRYSLQWPSPLPHDGHQGSISDNHGHTAHPSPTVAMPVSTVQKQSVATNEGYVNMPIKVPVPPDVILKQSDKCFKTSSFLAERSNSQALALFSSLADSQQHLSVTAYQLEQLLTPSPDSTGHWSSPRSTGSDLSEGTSSPAHVSCLYIHSAEQIY